MHLALFVRSLTMCRRMSRALSLQAAHPPPPACGHASSLSGGVLVFGTVPVRGHRGCLQSFATRISAATDSAQGSCAHVWCTHTNIPRNGILRSKGFCTGRFGGSDLIFVHFTLSRSWVWQVRTRTSSRSFAGISSVTEEDVFLSRCSRAVRVLFPANRAPCLCLCFLLRRCCSYLFPDSIYV